MLVCSIDLDRVREWGMNLQNSNIIIQIGFLCSMFLMLENFVRRKHFVTVLWLTSIQ